MVTLLWLSLLGLLLLIPTAYAGWTSAPYVPSLMPAIKKAFDYIKLSEDDVVVDLGAGDGKVVREAALRGAQARGIELSPIMWLVAWLRTTVSFLPLSKGKNKKGYFSSRPRIVFGNFYNASLADATVVFAFSMPANMPRIRRFLSQQVVPHGKYFLTYAFPFKDIQPQHVVKVPGCAALYIYNLPALTKS